MAKIRTFIMVSDCDGLPLSLCMALPDDEQPVALVQLAHGMAEHKERYLPFMEYLAQHGYASVINDHRGHGASVRSEKDLGYFYEGGADALVKDLRQITGGVWHDLYKGDFGRLVAGAQVSYTEREAFRGAQGVQPSTHLVTGLTSLRYYPF